LKDQYDFPHLVADKENLIKELNQDKTKNYWIIVLLGFVVALSLFLLVREIQQRQQYKKRFEALMQEQEIEPVNEKGNSIATIKSKIDDLGILPENVDAIVKQLDFFESQLQFLLPNITVQSLAQQMSTNSKYLSLIVNSKKGKTFSNYLNDLRVDYAVAELKENKELRKYTIEAIANEVGFNTAESFSNAFFKRTGIKPSFFIRKLQEL
jgi:AraC-like DNA-binding protein